MNEREQFYIKKFQSYEREKGYNISMGGDGFHRNLNIPYVQEIVKLLLTNEYSYQEISEITGQSQDVINNINQGYTYHNSQLTYPLKTIKTYHSQLLSNTEIKSIQEELVNNKQKTFSDIAKEYNVNEQIISKINQGLTPYYFKNINYPIRRRNENRCKFNDDQIKEIIFLLINSNLTQIEIAKQFHCDRKLIGQINSGKKYNQKEINYPIRKK